MNAKANQSIDAIARDCLAVRVRFLNRVITNLYDAALRPLGLKVSQMNVLVVAAKLGLARPAQVCHILHLDASTLSRNVERLRIKGWLEIVPDDDGRSQPFRVTPEGRHVLEAAIPVWQEAQRQASAILGAQGVEWLRAATRTLGLGPAGE
jgi:DNA-binding MarR family transcriptional regulator